MKLRKFLLLVLTCCVCAVWGDIRALTPQPADLNWTKGWWMPRHSNCVVRAQQGGAPIVFLGDSITHFWETSGKTEWAKRFADGKYRVLNLGFSGDRTEHVLWRLDHGELDGYEAKAIVLMIGTNNTGHFPLAKESPCDTILGIRAIIAKIQARQPKAKIILLPIFPRGATAQDGNRRRNAIVNGEIIRFADGKNIFWCDFTDKLMAVDGTLTKTLFPDFLHPAAPGYAVWAEAVLPYLDYALAPEGKVPPANRYSVAAAPNLRSVPGEGPVPTRPISLIGRKEGWWRTPEMWLDAVRKHRNAVAAGNGHFDIVFLGDSITRGWEGNGAKVLADLRKEYSILALGIGGDRVQHNIWRVENGEFDGFTTPCVMLMIGTNNNYGDKPEDVAAGIRVLLAAIQRKQPQAKILLLPVFPRGQYPTDPKRIQNAKVNELIRPFADGQKVIWLDFTAQLLQPDGTISKELMPDYLHPKEEGYRMWATAARPYFKQICGK